MATSRSKQALRQSRRQQGLCLHCGAVAKPGQTRCVKCAEKGRQSQREYEARHAAAGLCQMCTKPTVDNKVRCPDCMEKQANRERRIDNSRKEQNLCVDCRQPNSTGLTRCDECNEKMKESGRNLREQRLAAGLCGYCGEPAIENKKFCQACREYQLAWHRKEKLKVLEAYGGPVCVGCGEDELMLLQLDHINGGGNKHRIELGNGGKMYRWMRQNNYPPGFRVLCANCNLRAYHKLPFPNLITHLTEQF